MAHPQPTNVHWSRERAAQGKPYRTPPGDACALLVALPPAPRPMRECCLGVSSIWAQQTQVSLEASKSQRALDTLPFPALCLSFPICKMVMVTVTSSVTFSIWEQKSH